MPRVEIRYDGVSRGARRAGQETAASIKNVGDAADREDRKVSKFGSTIRSSLGIAVTAGAGAAVAGVGLLGGAVAVAGFRFNDLRQRAGIAFETMLGSAGKADVFLKDLQKFAASTPFEFPELIQTSQQLLAMGFSAKKVVPTLTAIGDATAALGGSPEVMKSITRALGQMQAKGKASAEEFLQLSEAGVGAWQMLADKIGTSVPEAMAQVSKGAVSSGVAIAAITEGMEKRFGGMMAKQSKTFSGLLSTVKDTFTQLSGTVMAPFFDFATKGLQRIVDYTSRPEFTAGVKRFADELATRVGTAVAWLREFFVRHWGSIESIISTTWATLKTGVRIFQEVFRASDSVAEALGGWKPTLVAIGVGFVTLKAVMLGFMVATRIQAALTAGTIRTALISTGIGALVVAAGVAATLIIMNWDRVKGWLVRFGKWIGDNSKLLLAVPVVGAVLFMVVEVVKHFQEIKSAIKSVARSVTAAMAALFDWLVKSAISTALKVVEPFSHLPGKMGNWAREAKTRLEAEMQKINLEATMDAKGRAAGSAFAQAFAAQASPVVVAAMAGQNVDASGRNLPGSSGDRPSGSTIGVAGTSGGGGVVSVAAGADRAGVQTKGHVIAFVAKVAGIYGARLTITTGTNHNERTTSGNISDHWSGNAADIAMGGTSLTRLGQSALIAAGADPGWAHKQTGGAYNVGGVNILFNTNIGGNHWNHLHVGLKSAVAATPAPATTTVAPDYQDLFGVTNADLEQAATGGRLGGSTSTTLTPEERKAAAAAKKKAAAAKAARELEDDARGPRSTARFVTNNLDRILSPELRASVGKRAEALSSELVKVTSTKDLTEIKRRLKDLVDSYEAAVKLGRATEIAQSSARQIALSIGRLPEQMRGDLVPRMAAVRDELGKVTSEPQLTRLRADLEKIQKAVEEAVDRLKETVEKRRDAFGSAFGVLGDKALQVFDAKTAALIEAAAAKMDDLDARLREKTNAERELAALDAETTASELAAQREKALADAETDAERQSLLARFALEDRRKNLQTRAEQERAALEAEVATERAARETTAQDAQKAIADERALRRERFAGRIKEIESAFRNEEISASEAQARLLALLTEFGTGYEEAGALVGSYFATGFRDALGEVATAVTELRVAVNELRTATGKTTISSSGINETRGNGESGAQYALRVRSEGLNAKYADLIAKARGYAGGGKIPGQFVSTDDTIIRAHPGETVVDRRLTQALERELLGGGSRSSLAGATIYVLGTTEREVARALRQIVDGAPSTPSYSAPRG